MSFGAIDEEGILEPEMKQMYENTQESEQDCEDMVQYFQTEFGANESGVTFLAEGNYSECKKVLQEDLSKTL